jgi:hypothetical protein
MTAYLVIYFPANKNVDTPYIYYIWFLPTLNMCENSQFLYVCTCTYSFRLALAT